MAVSKSDGEYTRGDAMRFVMWLCEEVERMRERNRARNEASPNEGGFFAVGAESVASLEGLESFAITRDIPGPKDSRSSHRRS